VTVVVFNPLYRTGGRSLALAATNHSDAGLADTIECDKGTIFLIFYSPQRSFWVLLVRSSIKNFLDIRLQQLFKVGCGLGKKDSPLFVMGKPMF